MSPMFLISALIFGAICLLAGFILGRSRPGPINVKDIDGYINVNFPDQWAAYHRGISEGYEQGLRDGRDQE